MNSTQEPTVAPQGECNKHPVFQVTQTSKYLAMLLFIIMPFVGGYIGYTIAPIKTVVVETTVVKGLPTEPLTIESAGVVYDGDIEVVLSNGEKKIIAQAFKPASQEQYFEIETYSEAVISPNRKFAALQGIGFEDSFVRIYNTEADRLEDKIWGEVQDWDNIGRLGILSCDLSGEECTSYISVSPDTPWVLEEVE
jgi:hypothetical protein